MKDFITNLFSKLQLWQKFVILGITALILIILPLFFYVLGIQNDIAVAKNETNGIQPSLGMQKVVKLTQEHRDLSTLTLTNEGSNATEREANEKAVMSAIAGLDALFKANVSEPSITNEWISVQQRWLTLVDQVKKAQITNEQSIASHSQLIQDYFTLLDKISDFFDLSLDPVADSYFMVRASLYATPKLTEALSRSKALGSELLAAKQSDPAKVATLSSFLALSKATQQESQAQTVKTFAINGKVKNALDTTYQNTFTLVNNALKLAEQEIVNKQDLSYNKNAFSDEFTTAINAVHNLDEKLVGQLQNIIENRKNDFSNQFLAVGIGLLTLLGLALFITNVITSSITRPVDHLMGIMNKLAAGDTKARANLQTTDEIGVLGRQFDMMVDQREIMNAQIQRENETLNNSIIEMLQAVGTLAQKDLTIKAPVAEDVTGPLGDALNYLTGETADVLNKVVKIANDVSQVSKQVKNQANTVINIATEERREVEQSAAELNVASEEMSNIAELALTCNETASRTIQNTDRAQETVLGTVQGITSIRDTIRETEKRIKRLGERSQEIGSIVTIINSIAERTHILALNASMHAASAGEAGRGFAVVANEVQKLAENAREATQQITGLVKNIQVETADTVTNMNDAITQVVRGTTLAQQAGDEMRETRDATAALVQLVQRIADGAKTQAETAQKLQERAAQIQKTTEQTFQELQEQGRQTDRLVDFSSSLVESVGVFKLPTASANF